MSDQEFFEEKRPSSVGAIIHSAQIHPIDPGEAKRDKSDKSGAMNDGPYAGDSALQVAFQAHQKFGMIHVVSVMGEIQ